MGRLLKNPDIAPGSLGVRLPLGTNSLSDAPVDGLIRFNQSTSKVELYYANQWNVIAKVGTVNIVTDSFTTQDGVVSYGPMSYSYESGQESNVLVFVGGVQQKPLVNYTFDGSSTITINPTTGTANQTITILHNFNSTDAV
jgi:hypothetical protein